MRRTIGLCGALALTALATTAAGAADYPYTGLYTTSDPATDADAALRNCAYNFFSQEKDGSYISYHLDLQHYVAEKTIRYVEYSRGHCAIEDGGLFKRGSVETCTSTFDTDPAEQGKSYIDVYREDGPGVIIASSFDKIGDARTFAASGTGTPVFLTRYSLCPDPDKVAKFISAEKSTLSPDERAKITGPEPDDVTTAIMTSVLKTIHDSTNP